jgi:HPt (histidine-containing phosphotransfer) domain-containing protein
VAAAISSGAKDPALRAAHTPRGSAANVGTDQSRELAAELEPAVNAGGLEFAQPLLEWLRASSEATHAVPDAGPGVVRE